MPEFTTRLTDRDQEILLALTHKVRYFTVGQLARAWWSDAASPTGLARTWMKRLEAPGFVRVLDRVCHPELSLDEPVFAWMPGQNPPGPGRIAYRLKKRWTEGPTSLRLVQAGPEAVRSMGGFGGHIRYQTQITHDLHMSTVYLLFREKRANEARRWVSEDYLKLDQKHGDKLPDAAILDEQDRIERLIEFGGAYPKKRVIAFHRFCAEHRLAYELW